MAQKQKPIEIQSAGDDGYYFIFSLPYHKQLVSRFYNTPSEVDYAVKSMRSHVIVESSIRKHTSPTGGVYFVLFDSNGEIVGQSTIFDLVTHMEIAIEYLRKHFPLAPTIRSI